MSSETLIDRLVVDVTRLNGVVERVRGTGSGERGPGLRARAPRLNGVVERVRGTG